MAFLLLSHTGASASCPRMASSIAAVFDPASACLASVHNDFSVGGHVNGVSIKPYTDMPAESVFPHYTVSLCSFGLSGVLMHSEGPASGVECHAN